jgi:hypothetical protein
MMPESIKGLLVLLGLVALALLAVVCGFIWLSKHCEEDPWFDEEQARLDAEELLASAAEDAKRRPRVRAIS